MRQDNNVCVSGSHARLMRVRRSLKQGTPPFSVQPDAFQFCRRICETQVSRTVRKAPRLRYMDPMLLIFPAGLIQAALIVVATCYSNSGPRAARNDLIGIRLWSTTFSEEAWRVGHRTGIFYSWFLAGVAVVSLTIGIWLIQREPPPSDVMVSVYTLGTLVSTLAVTGLMILRAHQAAKQVAINQVLEEEGDEIDALLDEKYGQEG